MQAGRIVGAVLLVMTAGAGRMMAQGGPPPRALTAGGSQNLDFGALISGVPTTILRTDTRSAGRFDLRGDRQAEVRIDLTLPVALTGPGGRTLPLQFGPADGGYNTANNVGSSQAFDPQAPLIARLGNSGRLYIWLGGTALPAVNQVSGTYTATVTLTAAYTGN